MSNSPPPNLPQPTTPTPKTKRKKWPWITGGTIAALLAIGGIASIADQGKDDVVTAQSPTPTSASTTTEPTTPPTTEAPTTAKAAGHRGPEAHHVADSGRANHHVATGHHGAATDAAAASGDSSGSGRDRQPAERSCEGRRLPRLHGVLAQRPHQTVGVRGLLDRGTRRTASSRLVVDWNEQAAKKAADYLDYTAFSHVGLIKQLEFEGFSS